MTKNKESEVTAFDGIPYSFDGLHNKVKWIELGNHTFSAPFFRNTIQRCIRENQKNVETGLDILLHSQSKNFVPVRALIFHVSRCGSTLLTQMLAQSAKNIVLSEPTIVNELLMSKLPEPLRKEALIKSLEILGKRRTGEEENLIIKLDSWHLLFFDFIKEVFPESHIVFLIREPSEVLRSHRKLRGIQMVPRLMNLQIDTKSVPVHNLDGYALKVLTEFYSIMSKNLDKADLLIDYDQFPEEGLKLFIDKTGLAVHHEERKRMIKRAGFDSKNPGIPAVKHLGPHENIEGTEMEKLEGVYSKLLKNRP